MDELDRLCGDTGPLLRHVDHILGAAGAPPGHPVWDSLRHVRLLTVDAVAAVTALRPAEVAAEAPDLRGRAARYAEVAASLPGPGEWSGDAADAYDAARQRVAAHLGGAADSLEKRLEASADLSDALVDWMWRSRSMVAGALAEVLTSAEAVTLATSGDTVPVPADAVAAAAAVAARVLRTVADVYDEVADLLAGTADLALVVPAPVRRRDA